MEDKNLLNKDELENVVGGKPDDFYGMAQSSQSVSRRYLYQSDTLWHSY